MLCILLMDGLTLIYQVIIRGAYPRVLIYQVIIRGAYPRVLIYQVIIRGAYPRVLIYQVIIRGAYPRVLIYQVIIRGAYPRVLIYQVIIRGAYPCVFYMSQRKIKKQLVLFCILYFNCGSHCGLQKSKHLQYFLSFCQIKKELLLTVTRWLCLIDC